MADKEHKDRDAEESRPRPKKPPGYRKFEKLLEQVIKAPPIPRHNNPSIIALQ
jgi:hypothetical protein